MFGKGLNRKSWFEQLVGFKEENREQVRQNLIIEDNFIHSKVNGETYDFGKLEIISLQELKRIISLNQNYNSQITIAELVANVQELHTDSSNKNAVFQAASQFNLLEMISPNVTPDNGITNYENDHTQGPACAIACGAGTIYRNYFVPIGNEIGQTKDRQIDCLDEIGKALNNEILGLWKMQNGYALASLEGLKYISNHINKLSKSEYETLKSQLKIGIQWHTAVTISLSNHKVSQVYCSALPVAYSQIDAHYWEAFAKLILEATYEATFYVALKNYEATGNPNLYLTLVGGGAFGNELEWILEAIEKSLDKFQRTPLNVKIVSFGRSNVQIRQFINQNNY